MTNEANQTLGDRQFTLADQLRFAAFSGDFNPIHVDPVAARRTISGACIVHGVHAVLWVLDQLAAKTGLVATAFKAKFLKPMFLEETLSIAWNPASRRLSVRAGDAVLATLTVTIGAAQRIDDITTPRGPAHATAQTPSFDECAQADVRPFVSRGDPDLAPSLFPMASAVYGRAVVNDIAALSQIVGMERPGLNSLFTALKVQIAGSGTMESSYRTAHSDDRFRLLALTVTGHALTAEIEAFYRPSPARNPSVADVAATVRKDEFKGACALIIGGTRGLGELVAKALAAGGGRSIITYSVGKKEAAQVADEIRRWGGECAVAQFTVGKTSTLPKGLPEFNQLYFFATPRIVAKRSQGFDEARYQAYLDIYVDGFAALCESVRQRRSPCAIFYPSTVFIDAPTPDFQNYVDAKILGEGICERLNQGSDLQVVSARLPRLPTDQTQSFTSGEFDDPLQVMLPWLRSMQEKLGSQA